MWRSWSMYSLPHRLRRRKHWFACCRQSDIFYHVLRSICRVRNKWEGRLESCSQWRGSPQDLFRFHYTGLRWGISHFQPDATGDFLSLASRSFATPLVESIDKQPPLHLTHTSVKNRRDEDLLKESFFAIFPGKICRSKLQFFFFFLIVLLGPDQDSTEGILLSLIHIWRCRRDVLCRSRWSPYH